MDCERAVEALIDRAAGQLPAEDEAALSAHLATCARCRAEGAEIEGLWNDLGALRAVPAPAHTDRLARVLRRPAAAPASIGWPLRAAAVIALLIGAGVAGRLTAPAAPAAAPLATAVPVGPQWMLLLHEDPVPTEPTPEVVATYAAWAGRLAAEGRLVHAEKLDGDPGTWLPAQPAASRITGFFIVSARDEADAITLARDGPHLSHGGTIEVRRIDIGGGRR